MLAPDDELAAIQKARRAVLSVMLHINSVLRSGDR